MNNSIISAAYSTIAYSISGLPRGLPLSSCVLLPAVFWEWVREGARDELDSVLLLFSGDAKNKSTEKKVEKAVKSHLFGAL